MSNSSIFSWSKNQAYLALGNLITVCALTGDRFLSNGRFYSRSDDDILDLKSKKLKSVLVLPIGYRSKDDKFSSLEKVRKDVSDNTIYFN